MKNPEELQKAIQQVEAQRSILGDEIVDASLLGLQKQLEEVQKQQNKTWIMKRFFTS